MFYIRGKFKMKVIIRIYIKFLIKFEEEEDLELENLKRVKE